jgi:hypothetical protein
MNNDELDPLLEEDADELLLAKKKGGIHSDDDDELFEGEADLEEEDPFLADLGYGFGTEDEDAY